MFSKKFNALGAYKTPEKYVPKIKSSFENIKIYLLKIFK